MFWKLQENILEKEDIELLVDFIRSTSRFTQFDKVREFEKAWSKWQGCKYSIFVNSGSSANLLMLNLAKELYGWQNSDEVLVPAVTWVTNITPIMQCGLKPVFVDINLDDLSFNYKELAKKITKRTRAIFVTHLLGFPADIKKIRQIIGKRDIKIFEDCCEAHGAVTQGKKVGNHGLASSFSFYWGHHMTTVEGGMVCTDDEEIYKLAVLKRSHGLVRELPSQYHDRYKNRHPDIDFQFLFATDGFNVRNTELHAVLGLGQLQHLNLYIKLRNKNYQDFIKIIRPYEPALKILLIKGISSFSLPFIFSDKKIKNAFQNKIKEAGIESRPIISGNLLRQPFLRALANPKKFTNAEFVHENGFYIGNNQFVNKERLLMLEKLLKEFFTESKI